MPLFNLYSDEKPIRSPSSEVEKLLTYKYQHWHQMSVTVMHATENKISPCFSYPRIYRRPLLTDYLVDGMVAPWKLHLKKEM